MAYSGLLGLTGIMLSSTFLKGSLDKLQVESFIAKRKGYKTAANTFACDAMTDEHREMYSDLSSGLLDMLATDIATDRRLDTAQMKTLFAGGPYSSVDARTLGLIDGIAYRDEVYAQLGHLIKNKGSAWSPTPPVNPFADDVKVEESRPSPASAVAAMTLAPTAAPTSPPVQLLFFQRFRSMIGSLPAWHGGDVKVAVVVAEGTITRGSADEDPFASHPTSIGSDTMCALLRQITRDKTIKAVIIRVNSGGGSYVASDMMAREIIRCQAAGKKVVVSMGNVCASGGYFMALNADAIVASPGTLTGSIGVFAGKLNPRGLFQQLGVTIDDVHTSDNATLFSSVHSYSTQQKSFIERIADFIYHDFTSKVAAGRKVSLESIERVAQGRVWLGQSAVTHRLVDSLGGWMGAVAAVRSALGLTDKQQLKLVHFPKPFSFWAQLGEKKEVRNSDERDTQPAAAWPSCVFLLFSSSFLHLLLLFLLLLNFYIISIFYFLPTIFSFHFFFCMKMPVDCMSGQHRL
jgi:protease-4